ncbi:hypothetical protein M885DRAFT_589562 [Pelagophyceae sp. CCMP2097]|nr:hypothetical protein M885DRAFT_589562 [Pelagophyceae sp. CCMP2097]
MSVPAAAPAAAAAPRNAADDDDTSDEEDTSEAAPLDASAVAAWKSDAAALYARGDVEAACVEWRKAAAHLKRARLPDAKLLSNLAAAYLSLDKHVSAANYGAESADADGDWWKGHWYRGQALIAMAKSKPPSIAMSERLEQAVKSFKACKKCSTLPSAKLEDVDAEIKIAKQHMMSMTQVCGQQ